MASTLLAVWLSAVFVAAAPGSSTSWWSPGQGTPLPEFATYDNDQGQLGVLNTSGPLDTKGHPFFEPIGTNGRACVTCHQPSDGMSLSVRSIRERWTATGGKDPLFAAVDGMNCPNLPPDDPAVALAAARARPVPRRAAVAAAASRRHAHRSRVHDRGRARSERLQHGSALRAEQRDADDLGVPPSAPGGQHEVHDAPELRRRPVHRQERHAGGDRIRRRASRRA